jgi:hypothetical protein
VIRSKPNNNTSKHKQSKLLIVENPIKSQKQCKLRMLEHDGPHELLLAITYDRTIAGLQVTCAYYQIATEQHLHHL